MRNDIDDSTVRVGEWVFHVENNRAFVHHTQQPGDIHIIAKPLAFAIEVHNDEVDTLKAKLEVPYEDLGPKMP